MSNSQIRPSATPPVEQDPTEKSHLVYERNSAKFEEVKRKILAAGDLPTLPAIAIEVSRLAQNPLTGMSDLVRIIRNDPSLTAKILRVANSAFYGMSRRIESLNMALVVLGMREISSLVTCISVLRALPFTKSAAFDQQSFWEHSAGTGEVARVITAKLHLRLHGVEFTAGLLHDIGKILMLQHVPNEFLEAVRKSKQEKIGTVDAERAVIGVDHTEVGAWLAEHWSLPDPIVESIRYHHQPHLAPEHRSLTSVVHLANVLAKTLLQSVPRPEFAEQLTHDAAWDVIAAENPELIHLDITTFADELHDNIERAREFIRMATE